MEEDNNKATDLMVGVGQIGHILHTAFKSQFAEEERIEDEIKAKEQRRKQLLEEAAAAKKAAILAAKLEAEEKLRAKSPPKAKKPDKGKKGKGAKDDEPEPEPIEVIEVTEVVEEPLVLEEPFDRYEEIHGVKLDPYIKTALVDKAAVITGVFQQQMVEAKQVISYLYDQRREAKLEETEEEEDLKRQGVLIGQHIPSLPTKLFLDKAVIARNGPMGHDLSYAGDLVEQNRDNKLRRTGNKPISDAAVERTLERSKKKANQVTEVPSYQLKTQAVDTKDERMKVRFATVFKEHELARSTAALTVHHHHKPKVIMTAEGTI